MRSAQLRYLILPLSLLLIAPAFRTAAGEAGTADDFVAYDCPIEGQAEAVVLGRDGEFQAACLSLSKPREPGPWTESDAGRVTGSAQFCPRPVLALLDGEGVVTVRFLPLAEGSYLADPAACCLGGEISVNPRDGRVRVATDGAGRDCLGGEAVASHEDIYRWDGSELRFLETRTEQEAPRQ